MIGESSLASPVFDSYGEAVGAIGVVMSSSGEIARARGPRRRPRDGAGGLPRAGRGGLAAAADAALGRQLRPPLQVDECLPGR